MEKYTLSPWIAEDEHRPNCETYQIHNGKEIIAHNVSAKNMPLVKAAPELLKALILAQHYINVFILRDEDPLVGENIEDDSRKIIEAIQNASK